MAYVFLTLFPWLELRVLYWGKKWQRDPLSCPWSWRRNFQSFTLEYDNCRLVIYGLYYVDVYSFYIQFVHIFVKEVCRPPPGWQSQMLFLHLLRWFYTSFCYCSIACWLIYMLNDPCFLRINPTLSWCMILWIYC